MSARRSPCSIDPPALHYQRLRENPLPGVKRINFMACISARSSYIRIPSRHLGTIHPQLTHTIVSSPRTASAQIPIAHRIH